MANDKVEITSLINEQPLANNDVEATTPEDVVDVAAAVASDPADQIFGPLPEELRLKIANEHLKLQDLARLSGMFRSCHALFQPILNEAKGAIPLLTDVVQGNVGGVLAKVQAKPPLLFIKSVVTDDAGQTFYDASAMQLIFFLSDEDMLRQVAPLIPLDKKQTVINQFDEIQNSGEDLVKMPSDLPLTTADVMAFVNPQGDIESLLKNKDGIIFSGGNFYYLHRAEYALIKLEPNVYDRKQADAFLQLCQSFEGMDDNTSRRSTREEHRLIAEVFGRSLYRGGVHYSIGGQHYTGSSDEFKLITAYQDIVKLQMQPVHPDAPCGDPRCCGHCQWTRPNERRVEKLDEFWNVIVSRAQQLSPAWLLQRFAEPGRRFDFETDFFNPAFNRTGNAYYEYAEDSTGAIFPRRESVLNARRGALVKTMNPDVIELDPDCVPFLMRFYLDTSVMNDIHFVGQLVKQGNEAVNNYIATLRAEVQQNRLAEKASQMWV